jgi:hypothetical protein
MNENGHDEEKMEGGNDEEDEHPPRPPRKVVGSKMQSWEPGLMESPHFLKKDGGLPTQSPMSVTHKSMMTIDSMGPGQASLEIVDDAPPTRKHRFRCSRANHGPGGFRRKQRRGGIRARWQKRCFLTSSKIERWDRTSGDVCFERATPLPPICTRTRLKAQLGVG